VKEPLAVRYAEARARVLAAVPPPAACRVPVVTATGRALLETVRAPHPLPPFRNSAMDGFAVRSADLERAGTDAPVTLEVASVIAAGHALAAPLRQGQAARIMTGALLPAGADAVVPFEECERLPAGAGGERARFRQRARPDDHVRDAGADVAGGEVVLERGREMSAYDVAVLVALGFADVAASEPPRVTILSTGDELLAPGEPLRPGAIRDSNLPMLAQLVAEAGGTVAEAKRLPDDESTVARELASAFETSDVVLSIGGVSAGDFDPVKRAISTLPEIELWRVAMRPGRPQAFAARAGRLFFGLPGNPASVACVFETLVRPALRARQGFADLDRPRVPVRAGRAIESRTGRTDFVRARLEWRDDALWAEPAGAQVSGHLLPQARAHALLVVPEEAARLEAGERAEAIAWHLPQPGFDATSRPSAAR